MARNKKTGLYKHRNKTGDEAVAFISPEKAKPVKSFNKYARKKAERKGINLPEEEKTKKTK